METDAVTLPNGRVIMILLAFLFCYISLCVAEGRSRGVWEAILLVFLPLFFLSSFWKGGGRRRKGHRRGGRGKGWDGVSLLCEVMGVGHGMGVYGTPKGLAWHHLSRVKNALRGSGRKERVLHKAPRRILPLTNTERRLTTTTSHPSATCHAGDAVRRGGGRA